MAIDCDNILFVCPLESHPQHVPIQAHDEAITKIRRAQLNHESKKYYILGVQLENRNFLLFLKVYQKKYDNKKFI